MKNLNELAIETFDKLLKLSDEEFQAKFDDLKPSDLSEILMQSGMFDSKGAEIEKKKN